MVGNDETSMLFEGFGRTERDISFFICIQPIRENEWRLRLRHADVMQNG